MIGMKRRATLLVALSLGTGGCFTSTRQLILPPVPQAAAKPLPQPRIEPPPAIDTPLPEIDIGMVALDPNPEREIPAARPAQKKKPTPVAGTPVPTPATPTPEVEPPAQPPSVPTTPQLSEILTEERRRQYENELAASVMRASGAVRKASGRSLNPRQKEAVERIQTFLEQAEKSKAQDLVTAWQLAHRADLLGADLLASLQ
jgi:hypothetical protein